MCIQVTFSRFKFSPLTDRQFSLLPFFINSLFNKVNLQIISFNSQQGTGWRSRAISNCW